MARTLEAKNPDGERKNQIDPGEAEEFFEKLDALHDAAETKAGEFRADIKEIYANASERMEVSRKVLQHEYKKRRGLRKTAKREADFEDSEKLSLEQLRAALGDLNDTPLGRAAQQ